MLKTPPRSARVPIRLMGEAQWAKLTRLARLLREDQGEAPDFQLLTRQGEHLGARDPVEATIR